jgi:DNA-binding winged helix-turn-helix (wHTH) protein/tetratricopeptide (TPR) repeat protein
MTAARQILFGSFRLDPVNACLWRGPEAIHLTPKVFAVLSYLLAHPGQLVTKDELLRAVWPDTVVGEASLTVCIREIRRVLGDQPKAARFIETRHRRGYQFIAPITEIDQPTAEMLAPIQTSGEPAAALEPASPNLVGRAAELLLLHGWLDRALRGERQVVFVTGEPGIGKTTLVEAFCRRLATQPDLWIACGQCFKHHGPAEPYLPVLEALNQLGRKPGGEQFVTLLARRAPTWLAQLPWLPRTAEQKVSPDETLGATPQRMLREIAEALEALTARTPLVLVFEDLHWSDPATLDLLSALARRRGLARLLLLATYRPVEVIVRDHPLHAVKHDLQTHRYCEELPLELLTEAAVAEYLALRFPGSSLPPALARLVYQQTEGNPLFMVNVVDGLVAQGVLREQARNWELRGDLQQLEVSVPESSRLTIAEQLAWLSREEQELLEGASVAGMDFSAAALAAALGEEVVPVEKGCERLARRQQFLCPAGVSEWPDGTVAGRYRFRHWLYQDVLYQRVTVARRQILHQRLGERLEVAFGDSAAELAAELAWHFEEGRDYRRAIRYLRQAADNSCRRFTPREALAYLQRALDLVGRLTEGEQASSRSAVLEQRGRVRRSTGDMSGSAEDFLAAAASAAEQSDAEVRALLGAAASFYFVDREKCLAAAERALDRSRGIQDPLLRVHVRGQVAHWRLQIRGWQDEHARAVYRAADLARRFNHSELLGLYLTLSSFHHCHQSEYRAACAAVEEALPLVLAVGDVYHYLSCLCFSAWAQLHLGEWGEAHRRIAEGLRLAERNGHRLALRIFQLFLAWLHEEAFDFEGARQLCESGLETDTQMSILFGYIRTGMAYLGLGKPHRAFDRFREASRQTVPGVNLEWIYHMQLHHGLSECQLARGELAEARREAEQTCALATQSGERTYLALSRRTLAETALTEGNWDQAEAELSRALAVLEGNELPLAEWRVYATAARLHQRRRGKAEAERYRARSLRVLHRLADSLGDETPLRRHLLNHLSS